MDEQRFDSLAIRVGTSRRTLLKKMVGLGGAAAVARLAAGEAEAARRGFSAPKTADIACIAPLGGGCNIDAYGNICCACCKDDHQGWQYWYSRYELCLTISNPGSSQCRGGSCCAYCAWWSGGCIAE